jgi:hypothetical protein
MPEIVVQQRQAEVWELQVQQDQQVVQDFKVPPVSPGPKAPLAMQAHQERMHNTVRVQIAVVLHLVLVLHLHPVLHHFLCQLQLSPKNNIHHKKGGIVELMEIFQTFGLYKQILIRFCNL